MASVIEERRKDKDGKTITTYKAMIKLKDADGRVIRKCARFDAKRKAVAWYERIETEIRDGRHDPTKRGAEITVSKLIERYMESAIFKLAESNQTVTEDRLKFWKKELGSLIAKKVTPAHIVEVRDRLRAKAPTRRGMRKDAPAGLSPTTVGKMLRLLHRVFALATGEWQLLKCPNPVKGVEVPKDAPGRTRELTEEEEARLLAAARAHASALIHPAIVISLHTGVRRGELLSLSWEDVDMKRGYITVTRGKEGDIRQELPLTPEALAAFKELWNFATKDGKVVPVDIDEHKVIPGRSGSNYGRDLRRPFAQVLKAAKVKTFTWHDLRHTAASKLLRLGVAESAISRLLGHKSLTMTARYAHVSRDAVRDAVLKLSGVKNV